MKNYINTTKKMKVKSIQKIKDELTPTIIFKIYKENLTIKEVIRDKIKPYNFSENKMNLYIEEYYLAIYSFINSVKYATPKTYWKKLIKGEEVDGFSDWFIKEVHNHVFSKTDEF